MAEIYRGTKVSELLGDPTFAQKWGLLRSQCPWATVFQDSPFLSVWFSTYAPKYEPVLVTRFAQDGSLSGGIAFAYRIADGSLVPAGDAHVPYQVWIAKDDGSSAGFLDEVFELLAKEFSISGVRFRFLPPGAPLGWFQEHADRCWLKAFPRPLMRTLPADHIRELIAKRRTKDRWNQLEQKGTLTLDPVDPTEFGAFIEEIIPLYDLRQGGIYSPPPFQGDPLKRTFYRGLMERTGVLHATALRLNGRLLAAHIGCINNREVMLGVVVHSPFFQRYSVAKLLILMLGLRMESEGREAVDMTPGGEYKERLATHHDEACLASVFFSASAARRYRAQRACIDFGKRHFSAQSVERAVSALREIRKPGAAVRAAFRAAEVRIYRGPACRVAGAFDGAATVNRDGVQDLLLYRATRDFPMEQTQFWRLAARRMENGSHFFTSVVDGVLARCCWAADSPNRVILSELGQEFKLPPHAAVLYGFYGEPNRPWLEQVLAEVSANREVREIYIAADSSLRGEVEKWEFEYWGSMFERRRFGRIRRWESGPMSEAAKQPAAG